MNRTPRLVGLGVRFAALIAVFYLSLHHWMRDGYWEFSGIWHYGLPLLDPRIPAALLFWLISTAFWILLVLPVALWLAERVPLDTGGRSLVAVVLSIGLGTRGVVGPLVVRALVGAPMVLSSSGSSDAGSWLTHPYAARWLILFTQAWWLLPLLIVALWLCGSQSARQPRTLRTIRGLLALYALQQPLDAPYLLTAGGPHGATQNLALLAFQEGFGRQEFGYASVLGVLLCVAALPLAWQLRGGLPGPKLSESPLTSTCRPAWHTLAALFLLPVVLAGLRRPGAVSVPPAAWVAALVSAGLAMAGGVWTAFQSATLSALPGRNSGSIVTAAKYWALLFPPLVLVLPMIRPWGYHTGAVEAAVLFCGMVLFSPHLALGIFTCELQLYRGTPLRAARCGAGITAAWAIWTELGVDVMLSQTRHAWLPLQGWMVWELSTVFRASPLAVPGWPLAWVGGALLAWLALNQILRSSSTSSFADPDRVT